MALIYGAEAYRPYTDGRTPWYTTASRPDPTPFPHNYFVPNFGADPDMAATAKNLQKAESKRKHTFNPENLKPAAAPDSYDVPSFGVDHDVLKTQASIKEAEGEVGHKFVASFAQPAGHPVDYFVPNFGVDKDIMATQKHVKDMEKKMGKVLDPEALKPFVPDVPAALPSLGPDSDIKKTKASLKSAEKELGSTWNLVQSEADMRTESDPICGTGGCVDNHKKTPLGYDIDYFVPNFGPDPDNAATLRSIEIGEAAHGHKLVMKTPESEAKWHNVAKDTDYNFDPALDEDMVHTAKHLSDTQSRLGHQWVIEDVQIPNTFAQKRSDPICGSGGCVDNHKKTPLGYDIDYFVPNFGPDPENAATMRSIEIGEAAHGHKLVMKTPESEAKWHNVAKDTDYNFDPALDEDMVHTAKHLSDTQSRLGHTWVIEDVQLPDEDPVSLFVQTEATSDPICGSGGCIDNHKKTALGYDINYFVPNFGTDPDNTDTANSIRIGEEAHGHKLIMKTPESEAKWHNVAKDTMYNFAPALDEDMIATDKHLSMSQDMLGHKWVIED